MKLSMELRISNKKPQEPLKKEIFNKNRYQLKLIFGQWFEFERFAMKTLSSKTLDFKNFFSTLKVFLNG